MSSVLFPNNRGLFVAALWEVFTLWHQRLLLQWKKSKTQRHHISFLGSGQLVFLVPRCFVSSSLRNQRNRFLNRSLFDCNAVCQEKRGGRAASNFNWKREKGCYQGRRSHLKSEGAQGGTFFCANFYCVFGRFGKMTFSVNLKKWGGSSPLCPPWCVAPAWIRL